MATLPIPPMRWMHIDPLMGPGFQPTRRYPAAGKYKRVSPLRVDDSEFEISVIWRSRNGPPLHLCMIAPPFRFDFDRHQAIPTLSSSHCMCSLLAPAIAA
jgi:hypothetical protein